MYRCYRPCYTLHIDVLGFLLLFLVVLLTYAFYMLCVEVIGSLSIDSLMNILAKKSKSKIEFKKTKKNWHAIALVRRIKKTWEDVVGTVEEQVRTCFTICWEANPIKSLSRLIKIIVEHIENLSNTTQAQYSLWKVQYKTD